MFDMWLLALASLFALVGGAAILATLVGLVLLGLYDMFTPRREP